MYHQDFYGLNDHRYMAREERDTVRSFEESYGVKLPTTMEVCGTCGGKGTHVNPDIDSHGLSREDFDEDPDFAESYFSGVYDVTCYGCRGRNVVAVVDLDTLERTDPETFKLWCDYLDDLADMWATERAERMMGA